MNERAIAICPMREALSPTRSPLQVDYAGAPSPVDTLRFARYTFGNWREPMYYRKKPVIIVAHRIGDDGWPDEIWEGVNKNEIILHLGRCGHPKKVSGYVEIKTLEGTMRGEVGDWIIRGVNGEFYPCKPDIFALTYESVEVPT